MRKLVFNKWFVLAFLLMISLSAFSVVAYKQARSMCSISKQYPQAQREAEKGEILWDVLSSQFSSVSTQ